MGKQKLTLTGILSLRPKGKRSQAFTLVELIVVITILAILGTIAFISLQGYSKSARDSTRISDLSAMKTSLGLFHLDAGKYPNTTEGFDILYSGSTVWTQGIFGEQTKNNVSRLDKIPKDPLTDKKYTYSLTKTKQEYQLAGIMESDEIGLVVKTNAADQIATALVTGNYNGQTLKSERGVICEILSIPSIISSELESTTDLKTILENKSLVYSGYNNLPSNYKGSKYKSIDGFDFESKKLVVYSDTDECKELYNPESAIERINLLKNLQTAYSGTIIQNSENIKGFVNIDISDVKTLNKLSATIVNNNLGGKLSTNISNQVIDSCDLGYIYHNGECSILPPRCEEGYTYNIVRDKCEAAPKCNIDYTYNSSTHLCQKIGTVVNANKNVSTSVRYCLNTSCGTSTSGASFRYLSNSQTKRYGKSQFDSNGNITKGEMWDEYLDRPPSQINKVVYNLSPGATKYFDSNYKLTNLTTINYTCSSGYTLSGTTCSQTLTETPICSNGGVLNSTINLCQLNSTCDIGVLNTSLDACVEN